MSFITKNEVLEYIHKVFGEDVEITDAKYPLLIQPSPDDLVGADPKDPGNCVLVHTVRRQHGAQMLIVWKKVAYCDLIGTDGVRRVNRLMVTKDATKLISDFDNGKPFEIGRAIVFDAPSKAQTLKAGRKRLKARKAGTNKWVDRRKRLTVAMTKKREAADRAAKRLVAANAKKDAKNLPLIKQRKKDADAALQAVRNQIAAMDKGRRHRAPKRFDLTTRNGAVGNYNLTMGKHGVHPDFYTPNNPTSAV
jgi:hypothetical protein